MASIATGGAQGGAGGEDAKPGKTQRTSLSNPARVNMIKRHRGVMGTYPSHLRVVTELVAKGKNTTSKRFKKFGDKVAKNLKQINLCEMDKDKEMTYGGRFLLLTCIDDPMVGLFEPINLVCEDDNGDAILASIHNIPHDDKMKDLLCFGQKLAITRPYWRIATDGSRVIRVENAETVVIMGKKETLCRYCCEENATSKCARCKLASYCSRDCQVADWTQLDHKLICKKK